MGARSRKVGIFAMMAIVKVGDDVYVGADKERSYDGDYMQAGRTGEEIVMKFLRTLPSVESVTDYRNLGTAQQDDVDICILFTSGRTELAEIKSDKHMREGGNVLFEVLRINHTVRESFKACVLGWSARSTAKYVFYYAPSESRIYQCALADLRLSFQRYTQTARKTTRFAFVETDKIKSTLNVLIPWEYCKDILHRWDVGGER